MSKSPFKFIAGDLSLDFVNTVDWTGDGLVNERLPDYDRLTRWAESAGVVPRELGASLRARAMKQPRRAHTSLLNAWRLRSQLQRLFSGLDRGRLKEKDLLSLNRLLARAARERHLAAARRGQVRWEWRDLARELDSFLWPIVWAAANLISSEDAEQIRICGGPTCGWMFVDRSRNRLRRWCQMETCGTREKSRRRARSA